MADTAVSASAIEVLLWDVDGTLADTELGGHRLAFNRAFSEEGLDWCWDESTYRRLLAVSGGRERIDHWCRTACGHPADPDLLARLTARKAHHYAALVRAGAVTLRPGVEALIAEAAAAGRRQAIVTTSSHAAVEALLAGALRKQAYAFSQRICGEDVRRKKPDPEAYRRALAALDPSVDPRRVLVLEDSLAGLQAASAAGLACLLVVGASCDVRVDGADAAALAVVEALAVSAGEQLRIHRGPPCAGARITLSWLESLIAGR